MVVVLLVEGVEVVLLVAAYEVEGAAKEVVVGVEVYVMAVLLVELVGEVAVEPVVEVPAVVVLAEGAVVVLL